MKLCWLVPDDRGGGVISVALSCCRQASAAGHDATLLLMLSPTGHVDEHTTFQTATLEVTPPGYNAPRRLVEWLLEHPQDLLFINGCEQADTALSFIPAAMRCVYVVHDTAPRYWRAALHHERDLDAIVSVSHVVAKKFSRNLSEPTKMRVIHNGTILPQGALCGTPMVRPPDLIFLGGDEPFKGAHDLLSLWPELLRRGFAGQLHWFGSIGSLLSAKILELPQSNRIVQYGRVARSALFERAARSRVLLMLSRAKSFGMATVEGMAMGCVPVAWDIDIGTREILDAEHAFYAPLGDYRRLAQQVLAACDAQPQIAATIVEHVHLHFSEEVMWQGYEKLLSELAIRPVAMRTEAGQWPPDYRPPRRFYQMLPKQLRGRIRHALGQSARIAYWVRDFRGV